MVHQDSYAKNSKNHSSSWRCKQTITRKSFRPTGRRNRKTENRKEWERTRVEGIEREEDFKREGGRGKRKGESRMGSFTESYAHGI
jgi:hypothetical protein